jgi:hypothetical protein
MNDMDDPTAPLAPDLVDELLSAELDGEFERAAEDLGLEAENARARLAATPGVADRRALLLRARDAIGIAPAVDELLEQRLASKALRASDHAAATHQRVAAERRRRLWLAGGSVAAAVLLVAGLAVTLRDDGSGTDASNAGGDAVTEADSDNGAGAEASESTAAADGVDLGDVSDPAALRQKVLAAGAQSRASSRLGPDASTTVPGVSQVPSASPLEGNDTFTAGPPTRTSCRDALGVLVPDATPQFDAHGTVEGRPVGVFVFTQSEGGRLVLVMTPDCEVLNTQLLN